MNGHWPPAANLVLQLERYPLCGQRQPGAFLRAVQADHNAVLVLQISTRVVLYNLRQVLNTGLWYSDGARGSVTFFMTRRSSYSEAKRRARLERRALLSQ